MKRLPLIMAWALAAALHATPEMPAASGIRGYQPKAPGRIRVALCQSACVVFRPETRIGSIFEWAKKGLHGDEDVIVFPELAFASFQNLSEAWEYAPAVWENATSFAKERNAYLIVNHPNRPEGADGPLFNETRVFAPDGSVVSLYRKQSLAQIDRKASFSPGSTNGMARLPFANIGILICKDAFSFPERKGGYADADILLAQFAHPGVDNPRAPEAKHFPPSGISRKELEDSRYDWTGLGKPYLAVNKIGIDGNYLLAGGTFASDASGKIVAMSKTERTIVFVDFALGEDGRIAPSSIHGVRRPESPSAGKAKRAPGMGAKPAAE